MKITYIPYNNGPGLPFYSSLKVGAEGDMIIKNFEKTIAFFFLVSDNTAGD